MNGFFEASEVKTTNYLPLLVPRCGACGLWRGCKSPKMPVSGEGRKGILIVAEAPGKDEDEQGTQLVGKAGQYLREVLGRNGIDLDLDCWKTNSLICRPPENRTPTNDEIDYCRPNLTKAIVDLNPSHIMPLGVPAIRSLLGPLWKSSIEAATPWVGWKIPLQKYNAWVTPTYHPSYVLHSEKDRNAKAIKVWFERHIEEACKVSGRPWETVPKYSDAVQVIMEPERVVRELDWIVEQGGPAAFDFETNMLKPHSREAEIVCASVCWRGVKTIAFPWTDGVRLAFRRFVTSRLPKIGANKMFEEAWCREKLGCEVNNWVWDVNLAAHHQDNRHSITSVKFQGFVQLGQEPWNLHIEPYLEAPGGNDKNRIREVDMRSLCVYCGVDSIVEYEVAVRQRKAMKR